MSSKFRSTRLRTAGPSVRSGPGPLRNLIDRISLLESKVVGLESELRLAKRKLANSNGTGRASESLINELLTSKLSKQQFAMTLVPITDDIRITSVSGGGAATPAPKAPLLVPVPCSSPFQTQAQTVLIKTDPDAPEILGDESTTNSGFTDCDFDQDMDTGDIDIEWRLQNTDCDSKAKDPDWKVDSNTSKSNPDTTKKRKRAETEEKQDLSGYQIEVVPSSYGKQLLAINGFTFRRKTKRQNGEIGYWTCTKRECKATCKTIGPNHEVVAVSPDETHGHSSNSTEIEKRKIIAKLKSDANTSTEKTAKLVDSTIAELSQGVNNDVARLLDKKYLVWSINKLRKMSQPSTSNSETQNQSDGSGPSGQGQDQPQEVGQTVGT